MFPIGDDDIRGAPPPLITWALVVVNVLVFFFELSLNAQGELETFMRNFGVVPTRILRGEQLYALFTSMFLHGGWMHIISNMAFLLVFGDNIEAVLGKLGYAAFYIAGGLAASAVHVVINASSSVPSLGASGALAAVMGAYVLMFPKSQIRALVFIGFYATVTRVAAFIFLGIWFVTQLFSGFASLGVDTAQTGGVAVWAHIGGFVFGLLLGVLLRGRAQEVKRGSMRRS
jgi:membrane associated rhomboid family serine protease